jgi:methionyl-tRNA formyltransferase
VLVLSPYPDKVAETIRRCGDDVSIFNEKIENFPAEVNFVISFGYRHILKASTLANLGNRVLNLHTSALPWNKGAHPNFWSWVDGTPKGVTLHVIDQGVDTGPIVAQEIVPLDPSRTLEETYFDLRRAAEMLFDRSWPFVRTSRFETFAQAKTGHLHKSKSIPRNIDYKTPACEISRDFGSLSGDVFA